MQTFGTLRSLATLTALVTRTFAYMSPVGRWNSHIMSPRMASQLRMVSGSSAVPIHITGNNIEVTPAIRDYVNSKIGLALSKVGKRVTKCDVHIIYDKNPSITNPAHAEVTLFAKGQTIRASKKTHDMYASIDEVSDMVRSKLVKYKERIIDSHRKGALEPAMEASELADYAQDNEEVSKELGLLPTPAVDMSIVKKKKFRMDPISVEEAILSLDFIEHDFYVFKNAATGKINVVYKRNRGGVGLIEPE